MQNTYDNIVSIGSEIKKLLPDKFSYLNSSYKRKQLVLKKKITKLNKF